MEEKCVQGVLNVENDSEDEWEENDKISFVVHDDEEGLEKVPPRKRKRRILSKDEISWHQNEKRSGLKQLFQRMLLIASWTFEDEAIAFVSSIIPEQFDSLSGKPLQIPILQDLVKWFRRTFDVIDSKSVSFSEGRDGCSLSTGLNRVLHNSCGTHTQLVQIFITLLHSLQATVRLICTIDPPVSYSSTLASDGLFDGYVAPQVWAEVFTPSPTPPSSAATIERGSWTFVDPVRGFIGDKLMVESQCRPRRSCVVYVFSVDVGGHVKDVTSSYAQNPVRTGQKRLKKTGSGVTGEELVWWTHLVDKSREVSPTGGKRTTLPGKPSKQLYNVDATEGAEAACSVLPRSITACKNHPVYTLGGRQLGKSKALRPGAQPVGLVDGQLIYRRGDVSTLLTAFEWKKIGDPTGVGRRIVNEDEVPVRRRKVTPREATSRTTVEHPLARWHCMCNICAIMNLGMCTCISDAVVCLCVWSCIRDGIDDTGEGLYGDWQTRPLVPPQTSACSMSSSAFDGIDVVDLTTETVVDTGNENDNDINLYDKEVQIPRNKHGNVELLTCAAKGDLRMYGYCGCFEEEMQSSGGRFAHVPSVFAARAVEVCNHKGIRYIRTARANDINDQLDEGEGSACGQGVRVKTSTAISESPTPHLACNSTNIPRSAGRHGTNSLLTDSSNSQSSNCKDAIIPYADAVTGFRSIGVMKYAPQLDGVVVLRRHADMVYEVALSLLTDKEAMVEKRRVEKILNRWKRIYTLVTTRCALREKYGS